MPALTDEARERFRTRLEARRGELQRDIREGVAERESTDQFTLIAGEVADAGDASVGTEQSDLRNAQIDRDIAELQQVESALVRLEDDTFGLCIDCGVEIEEARLQVNPSAARCIRCQTAYEKRYGSNSAPTL